VPVPADAARILQSLPGVENVQADGNSLIVTGVESPAIMACLLQNNIIPTEITNQKSSLEALFMDVTSTN
jgi:hypothetical protein